MKAFKNIDWIYVFIYRKNLVKLQAALPWAQCVAEMWTKDRPSTSPASTTVSCTFPSTTSQAATATPTPPVTAAGTLTAASKSSTPAPPQAVSAPVSASNPASNNTSMDMTRVVKILKQNEPLVSKSMKNSLLKSHVRIGFWSLNKIIFVWEQKKILEWLFQNLRG